MVYMTTITRSHKKGLQTYHLPPYLQSLNPVFLNLNYWSPVSLNKYLPYQSFSSNIKSKSSKNNESASRSIWITTEIFLARARFEPTEVESCNLWRKRSTSKPKRLDYHIIVSIL